MPKVKKKTRTRRRKKSLPKVSLLWRFFSFFYRLFRNKYILSVVVVLLSIYAAYIFRVPQRLDHKINDAIYFFSSQLNLVLKDVYLEGQNYANQQEILRAIAVRRGQSMFTIDLSEIKTNLQALPWIDYAIVERQFPSTLIIRILEKKPAALWQNQGAIYLIDHNGQIIEENDLQKFSHLIIIVGADAPQYIVTLFDALQFYPDIKKLVSSVIRVGNRRWDFKLHNGIRVKFPEFGLEDSLKYLSQLHKKENILDSDIVMIDLRVPEKIYIKKGSDAS